MRSGVAGFAADAAQHFFLPERYSDPFDNASEVTFDSRDLFLEASRDSRGNETRVTDFDFRVLVPRALRDANGNVTRVAVDVLGMSVAVALTGGGDTVPTSSSLLNPEPSEVARFFELEPYDEADPRRWLDEATTRFVYDFGEVVNAAGTVVGWEARPAAACTIQRETHVAQLDGGETPIQVAVEYSDGSGNVLVRKAQAEPDPDSALQDPPLRWIATGKTVLNNKGKPVKQYEPYFSRTAHRFDTTEAEDDVGVTPLMFYDAPGRLVRTELPDGTFSRVEFSPWLVRTFDQNDTVKESRWYRERLMLAPAADQRAATLAADHAETPSQTHLDSLGRNVVAIAHNRTRSTSGTLRDEFNVTHTRLDAEGKPLWIRDARGNLVMQYVAPHKANNDPGDEMPFRTDAATGNRIYSVPCYDVAGNLLFQHSMDAGDRWMLMDAAGKAMLAWDRNHRQTGTVAISEDRLYFTRYDALRRPIEQWLSIDQGSPRMIERFEYSDARMPDDTPNPDLAALQAANLLGQPVRRYDTSGCLETVRRDFKGNTLQVRRRLNNRPQESLFDWQTNPEGLLETEAFAQLTEFDALNRILRSFNWHRDAPRSLVARYEPDYNRRGLLTGEQLTLRLLKGSADISDGPDTRSTRVIREIRYNEKGQKTRLVLGNDTVTRYEYNRETFRLVNLRTRRDASDSCNAPASLALTDGHVIQDLRYTYDPVGNITEMRDAAFKDVFYQNRRVEPVCRYEYDALYRLVSASGRENGAVTGAPTNIESGPLRNLFPCLAADAFRSYAQTYDYDEVGNLLRVHHDAGIGTWTRRFRCADDSNRLTASWDTDDESNVVNATAVTQYESDMHGNMLNLQRTSPRFNMRWDHRDMIDRVDLGSGFAYYQYDADKQRVRKRIERTGGIEQRIYLDGYELHRRYSSTGTTLLEEIESHHAFDGAQRVLLVDDVLETNRTHADGTAFATDSIYRYQYSNHLGSACLELDHQAAVVSHEEYHPYGTSAYRTMRSASEAPSQRYRYTGMEMDEESGLSYHGARYYSMSHVRWIGPDPSGAQDGLNRFLYVGASPANLVDLNGQAKIKLEYVAIGFGVALLGIAAGVLIVSTAGLAAAPIAAAIGVSQATMAAAGSTAVVAMGAVGAIEIGKTVGEIASEQEYGTRRPLTDEEYSMKVGGLIPNAIAAVFGLKGLKGGGGGGSSGGEAVLSRTLTASPALVAAGTGPVVVDLLSAHMSNSGSSSGGGSSPGETPAKKPEVRANEAPKQEGPHGARRPGSRSRFEDEGIKREVEAETSKVSKGERALDRDLDVEGEATRAYEGTSTPKGSVSPRSMQKVEQYHHLLVQQLRRWFSQRGVDIDQFTVKLSSDEHRLIHNEYNWNKLWKDFRMKNPNASPDEIISKMNEFMKAVGLEGLEVVPYPNQ